MQFSKSVKAGLVKISKSLSKQKFGNYIFNMLILLYIILYIILYYLHFNNNYFDLAY